MLKLIKCEFLKLKRKKFIPLIILAAFLFPIPLTYLMTTPSMMERYTDRADAFDGLFNMVLGYGIQFLLPCIIGVIAAILFFMERDNDTFKNLRTIPVTSTQMVLATVYKGNIIKTLIMDCQSYTKYRPNETTGGIFVSWRRKEELPTGA